MLKFTLIISDDEGVISNIEKSFDSPSVMHNFADIESCCEEFVKSSLPSAEQQLLAHAQSNFEIPAGKKKRKSISRDTR